MKTRSQKLISLVLVLMMLVTMIPAGFFGASAVSAELAAGLADYENTAEFVINNVDDWEAVAALNKDWNGKTIKLGANIGSVDATSLLSPLAGTATFHGTFDGNNKTMTNIKVNHATSGLFADRFDTGTVKNLTINGLTVESSNASRVGGLACWIETDGKVLFENITITGLDVKYVGAGSNVAVGGLIGSIVVKGADTAATSIKFSKINMSGSIGAVDANGAGVSGMLGGLVGNALVRRDGLVFENVLSAVNINHTKAYSSAETPIAAPDNASDAAGGIAGRVTVDGASNAATAEHPPKVEFSNCMTSGTLTSEVKTGGFVGYTVAGNNGILFNMTDCISAVTIAGNRSKGGYAYTASFTVCRNAPTITYTNCAVTIAPLSQGMANYAGYFMGISGGWKINGVSGISGYGTGQTSAITDIPTITEKEIAGRVSYDSNGFIEEIDKEGLNWDLFNYSSNTTFTINSVADWNYLAEWHTANNPANVYNGKTFVLGNDLIGEVDENGKPTTTLPALFSTGHAQFSGTLDGNGKTIKNFNTTSLLTPGNSNGGSVKNIILDNVHATCGTYAGLFFGVANNYGAMEFSNITIKNSSVTGGTGRAGFLFGILDNKANTSGTGSVVISNVTIADSILNAKKHMGALFGSNQTSHANTSVEIDTIKLNNVTLATTVSGNIYAGGLIGLMTAGDATNSFSVKNVTMSDVNVFNQTDGYATGGLIGMMSQPISMTVENIVADVDIVTTLATETSTRSAGALFGRITTASGQTSTIENVNVSGTLNAGIVGFVGGFIGRVDGAGALNINSVKTTVNVTGTNENATNKGSLDYYAMGGLIGSVNSTTITLNKAYVFSQIASAEAKGGLLGDIYKGNLNATDVLISTTHLGTQGVAITHLRNAGTVNYSNLYCTLDIANTQNSYYFVNHSGTYVINGTDIPAFTHCDASIITDIPYVPNMGEKKGADLMVKENANGFVEGIYTTTVSGLQVSAISNGRYAVRFVAFDFLGDATNVSMNVIARVQGGIGKTFTSACTMYTGLTAYHAQGITKTYEPGQFGAEMIAGFTIYNIPAEALIEYTVTVTYTTADGTFSNVMTVSIANEDGNLKVIQ